MWRAELGTARPRAGQASAWGEGEQLGEEAADAEAEVAAATTVYQQIGENCRCDCFSSSAAASSPKTGCAL